MICRQRKYGIRLAEVERHLNRQHQFSHADAVELAQAGDITDSNPWLRITRWAVYQKRVHPYWLAFLVSLSH